MADLVNLFNHAVEGAVAAFVAVMVYVGTRYHESKKLKYNLADMLSAELASLDNAIRGPRMSRAVVPADYGVLDMPREAYDGLVNSGNIAHFDRKLQIRFQKFYAYERKRQYGEMESEIVDLLAEIDRFQNKNSRLYKRAFGWLKRFVGRLSRKHHA